MPKIELRADPGGGYSRRRKIELGRPPELQETIAASAPIPDPIGDEFLQELDRRRPSPPPVEPSTAALPSPLARVRAEGGGEGFIGTAMDVRNRMEQGALRTIGAIPKGLAEMGGAVREHVVDVPALFGIEAEPVEDTALYQAGQAIQDYAETYRTDPARDERLVSRVAEGLGSTVPFLAGGGLGVVGGAATAAGMGAAVNASQTAGEAVEAGRPELREEAAAAGAVPGLLEGAPIGQVLRRLDAVTGGTVGRTVWNALRGGGEEAAQEAFTQGANNLIASGIVGYDPERDLFEGMAEAGETGFTVGAILNGLATMLGGRRGAAVAEQAPSDSPAQSVQEESRETPPTEPPLSPASGQQAPQPDPSSRPDPGVPTPAATPQAAPAGPAPQDNREGGDVPPTPPDAGAAPAGPPASDEGMPPQEPQPPDPNQIQAAAQQDLRDTLDDPRPQAEIDAERAAQAAAMEAERAESERQAAAAIREQLPPGFAVILDPENGWTMVDPEGEPVYSSTTLDEVDVEAWPATAREMDATFDYDAARRVGDGTRDDPVKVQAPSDVDAAAAVAEEPTPAQAEAGNYRKGHLDWNGLPITVETARGEVRRGTSPDGKPWEAEQPAHYGYIKRSEGADGDQVDVYLGDAEQADWVLVIDQIDPETGAFDEHKAMLGFETPVQALATYEAAFTDGLGAARIGKAKTMPMAEFRSWLKEGSKKPVVYDERQGILAAAVAKLPEGYRIQQAEGSAHRLTAPTGEALITTSAYPTVRQLQKMVATAREHAENRAAEAQDARDTVSGTQPPPVSGRAPRPRRARPRGSPQSIVSFIVARGGVRDTGGDLRAMDALRQRPGLINNSTGQGLDYHLTAAIEAGFLREDADTNDLLELIDRELRGDRQYRVGEEPEAEADPERERYELELEAERLHIPFDETTSDEELRDAIIAQYDARVDAAEDEDDESIREVLSGEWQPSEEVDLGPSIPFPDLISRPEAASERPAPAMAAEPSGGRQEDRSSAEDGGADRAPGQPGREASAPSPGRGAEDAGLEGPLDSEQTPEGEQTLIPGVRPVTDRDRIQAQMDKPLRGGDRPLDDGLFDTGARQQDELFMARPSGWTEGRIRREIRRGQAAIDHIIREHGTVAKAMFRPEVGEIAFFWGKPGNPPDFKRSGYGISHIIARRDFQRAQNPDATQNLDGHAVARLIPEVIARGTASQYITGKNRPRVRFDHNGWTAVVALEPINGHDVWLVTGFREDPDASGQPIGRSPELRTTAHPGASGGVGAGPAKNVSPKPEDDKDTLKRPVEGPRRGSLRRPFAGTLPQPPKPQEVRAVHTLIRKLADAVGATIRHGRVRERSAEGVYNLKSGIIRVRNIQDIEVSAHEIAHHTEDHYGEPLQKIMEKHKATLIPFDYEPMRDDEEIALKEGFAEWFRIYITGNPNAIVSASGFATDFEAFLRERDPEVLEALHDVRQAYQTWLLAPSDMVVKSNVVSLDQGGRIKRTVNWLKSPTKRQDIAARARRLYTALIDRTHPIAVSVRHLLRIYERNNPGQRLNLRMIENPAVLARLAADSNGTGFTDVMHGVVSYETGRPEGPSLAQALEKALAGTEWSEEEILEFGAYLYSRRAVHEWDRYMKGHLRNRPTLETAGDHAVNVAAYEAKNKNAREAADLVYAWANALWRKKYEAGLVSKEVYEKALQEHPDYVPMMRWGEDLGPGPSGTGRTGKSSIVKTFGGSDRAVINPIETLMRDAYVTERAIADNEIKRALYRIAVAAGPGGGTIVERVKDKVQKPIEIQADEIREAIITKASMEMMVSGDRDIATLDAVLSGLDALNVDSLRFWRTGEMSEKGEPIVYLWENGKRISLRLADGEFGREIYDSLVGLDREVSGFVTEILAGPARLLRAGITTEPSFILANGIRDMLSAWVLVDRYNPVTGLGSGLKSALAGDEAKIVYVGAGGIMGGEDANSFRQRALLDIRKLKNGGMNIRRLASWRTLFQVTEISETAGRVGIFKNAYAQAKERGAAEKEAIIEAAYTARDYIDFGRHGSRMLAARRVVTFLNAALQGMDKSIRVLGGQGNVRNAIRAYVKREHGFELTPQEKRQLKHSAKAWLKVNLIGMIGLAITSYYKDDEEYKNLSEYVRATHWMIRLGGPGADWIAIPKPFELATLSNIYERAYEALHDADATAWGKLLHGLNELWVPPWMPTAVGPIAEWWANKDLFDGAPIMSDRLLGRTPEEQFTQYTSSFAKWMGEQTGLSPVWIDHFIIGYTGTWGRSALALTSEAAPGAPSQGWEDLPFFRRFVKEWTRSAVAKDRFYNEVGRHGGRLTAAFNVFDDYVEEEQFADAVRYWDTLDPDQRIYAAWRNRSPEKKVGKWTANRMHPMYRADEAAGTLRNVMDSVRTLDDLSGDEKKRVIDLIEERVVYEMHNAMVLVGAEGYDRRRYFDLEANLEAIRDVSPEVATMIEERTERLPPFDYVQKKWPQIQEIARRHVERLRRKAAQAN